MSALCSYLFFIISLWLDLLDKTTWWSIDSSIHSCTHSQSPLFYCNNPVRGEIIRRIKRKIQKRTFSVVWASRAWRVVASRRRFEILIERDNRLPAGDLCVCCCCFGFFTLIVCVYCTNTHQRIKSKKDGKKILAPNVGVWRRDKRGNQTADTTTC